MKIGQRPQDTTRDVDTSNDHKKQNQIANNTIYCHAFYVLIISMFMYTMCGFQLDLSSKIPTLTLCLIAIISYSANY